MPRLRLRARSSLFVAIPISLASGLALSLAFPPAGIWPLAFVALIPLLWLLAAAHPRRGLALGLVFGLGFYGATLSWIALFGFGAWAALTLGSAASTALFGFFVPAVRRPSRPVLTSLAVAGLWTALDWARGMWPLGGFTWGSLGISQVDNRVTLRLASLTGVWGVTFVVVLVNGLLLSSVDDGGGAGLRRLGRVGLAGVFAVGPLAIPFPTAAGPRIEVATVQVDVRAARSAPNGIAEDVAVARLNIEQDRRLASPAPDLVVWGEGALDPGAASDPATMEAVRAVIARAGAPTLVGAVTDDPDGRERTTALLFDGRGRLADRYDKVHLVPFGEYVPWRDHLAWFRAIDQIPVDRTPGDRIHTVATDALPPLGAPICFENSFPDIPRSFVRDGGRFLVVTVNNASYGFTAASAQHEQMSRMRAVETGRWVVNAAVSGISAFIDPSGRVTEHLGLFRTGILEGAIRSSDSRTWYVRLGDWLPWVSLAFVLGLVAVPRRRRSTGAPAQLPEGARTLVVLPTFNERDTIEPVLRGVLHAGPNVDALVVDDASPDGTAEVVRAIEKEVRERVRLIERPAKSGLGSAYLEGFRVGLDEAYDLIVEMDSDLSHDPRELPGLLAAARRFDLTVGSRYIRGGSVTNWSRTRVALSRVGNVYARHMLGLPVHDATSGYRVYRRGLLKDLVAEPFHADGYGFQVELVMRSTDLGAAVGEAPITFRERQFGESKISRRIVAEALWLVTIWGLRRRMGSTIGPRPEGDSP